MASKEIFAFKFNIILILFAHTSNSGNLLCITGTKKEAAYEATSFSFLLHRALIKDIPDTKLHVVGRGNAVVLPEC